MAKNLLCLSPAVLQQLREGAVPESELSRLRQHLATCADCQKRLQDLAAGDKSGEATASHAAVEAAPSAAIVKVRQGESTKPARPEAEENEPIALAFLDPKLKPRQLGKFAHYEIIEVIGRGGMGIVFKALDPGLHRIVALKVMLPQAAAILAAQQRFLHEARAAAAVRDEHVIAILAVAEAKGLPYLVMPFVAGESLRERLDRCGPLSLDEILRIGMQIAQGLTVVHRQGLVHGNIKPTNILLENGTECVKITDFGLVRVVNDAHNPLSSAAADTLEYLAPEQASGQAVDHRANLLSLGSVLYFMCTGQPPFHDDSSVTVLSQVCAAIRSPIRATNPNVPEWLTQIIARLHTKARAGRFQSAEEVARVLGNHLARLQPAKSAPRMPAPLKAVRARPAHAMKPEHTTAAVKPIAPALPAKKSALPLVFLASGIIVLLLSCAGLIGGGIAFYYSTLQPATMAEVQTPDKGPEAISAEGAAPPAASLQPAAATEADKELPPDLDLVPSDGAAFLSVQIAHTWTNPLLAPVRQAAETDKDLAPILKTAQQATGLQPGDIERGVLIFWGKQRTAYSVGLVTTVKPYDRQRIVGLIGDGQHEEKVGDKTILTSPKNPMALHLVNERTFLYGRAAEVKKLLEHPARPTRKAVWNEVLRSAPRHTLQIGVQRALFPDDPKKDLPSAFKVLNPLLDAHTAVAALDAGKDLQLTMRFMYADEEAVKQAETAGREGLHMAAGFLGQLIQQLKKKPIGELPSWFSKIVALTQDLESALKKATIQSKDRTLECQLRVQSADWPQAVAKAPEAIFLAAMLLAADNKPTPPRTADKPAPSKVKEPKTPEEAEAVIRKLGGEVKRDNAREGRPIVSVSFVNARVTDDDLVVLRPLSQLTALRLLFAREITDKGLKHLSSLVHLEELTLTDCRVTNAGLAELKRLTRMKDLKLNRLRITDKGLVHLKEMRELEVLSLGDNDGITDKALPHLDGFSKLKMLWLRGSRVSEEGVTKFKEARPAVIIVP